MKPKICIVISTYNSGITNKLLFSAKNELKNFKDKINENSGIIYTGNPEILKKICPGEYGTIKPVGYCMIGRR